MSTMYYHYFYFFSMENNYFDLVGSTRRFHGNSKLAQKPSAIFTPGSRLSCQLCRTNYFASKTTSY